jgi:phosphosulfolactate synthase
MTSNRAWEGVFDEHLTGRAVKPRRAGLNMVIDKHLGRHALADLLETAGEAIDHIKFAFGTSIALGEPLVRAKIEMIRANNIEVYPGGTLGEAALVQGVYDEFLRRARELQFSMIEVSDGTIHLTRQQRAEVLQRVLDSGLKVISEVGKKDPRQKLPATLMRDQIAADLEAGASYVIVEAREGGKGVGIFDQNGTVQEATVDALIEGLDSLDRIVWEAPQCSQQAYLINRFGPNVNLGNIQPLEVLALEAMRGGFRFETLRKIAAERAIPEVLANPLQVRAPAGD